MKIVLKGNLLDYFDNSTENITVLAHGCNCFNVMGAGIAKQIKISSLPHRQLRKT